MFIVNCGIEAGTTEAVDFSVHSGGDLPLGCSRFHLVFLAVLSCHVASSPEIPPADMALIHAAIASVSICLFSLAAASLGNLILRTLHLEMDTDAEHLLICSALGAISIEMLLFSVEVSQQIRTGCLVIVGLLCIIILAELRLIASRCSRILKAALSGSRADHLLLLQEDWRIANLFAKGLVALLCLTYGAGLVMYSRKPVATALGIIPEVRYLEERRPEYQEAEAINHALGSQAEEGKTLLFLRHMYSLNVPFLNGDPVTSWMINPDHLRTPLDWRVFLQQEGIAYVVRSPKYPTAIEAPLAEMEAKGDLTPFAEFVVQDFQGMRIEGIRIDVPIRILRVKSFDGPKTQNKH